jgi:hypothetical protein
MNLRLIEFILKLQSLLGTYGLIKITSINRQDSKTHTQGNSIDFVIIDSSGYMSPKMYSDTLRLIINNYNYLNLSGYTLLFSYPKNNHFHLSILGNKKLGLEYWVGSYTNPENFKGIVTPVYLKFGQLTYIYDSNGYYIGSV